MRIVFGILSLLLSFSVYSQNKVSVSGKIIDKTTQQPLESATIYFEKIADSSIVDYSISGRSGDFKFEFRPIDYPIRLKISFFGYQTYKKDFQNLTSDVNLQNIQLEEKSEKLNALELTAEAPPIVIKTDTLEFNASSFKVDPDANVEKLLKQLPGVEIDEEGKITVNGKEVNNILVNGKPFFGKDGKVATQNLPADMINKIQVTDTKTKQEELSGDNASSNESTINLTIDEDKNKGFFGKATAGYGSDERYESSLMLNYFKEATKISLLGSSNNINSVGFSMDEIFDNMGGGRSRSIWVNDNGSFGINGMRFGGNNGITQSNMIGLNYDDEWLNEKIETNGSYYFSDANTKNRNRTQRTNLLPTGTTNTTSEAITDNKGISHSINFNFEIKVDSTFTVYVEPMLRKTKRDEKYSLNAFTTDANGDLLNNNIIDEYSDINNSLFTNNIFAVKNFKRKGRNMSLSFETEIEKFESDDFINQETVFYESGNSSDIRNQKVNDIDDTNKYSLELSYTEPVLDSLRLEIEAYHSWNNGKMLKNTLNYNALTNDFTDANDLLTNTVRTQENRSTATIGLQLRKKKINGTLKLGTDVLNYNHSADYLGVLTRVKNEYIYPRISGYFNYRLQKSKSIYVNFRHSADLPTARQVLPFEDLSNSLNTLVGNENLDFEKNSNLYFGFNNYDYSTRSGMYVYGGGSITKDKIVSSTVYDEDFKSVTTFQNVDNATSGYAGISFSKSYKKEKRSFRVNTRLSLSGNLDQGLTNAELYKAKGYSIRPRIALTWSIEDLVTLKPSYQYSYNKTNYENYVVARADNFTHTAKLETTSYWPNNVVFGNDFGYTYNSNIASGFQKDFYLWNISLGYYFFNKDLLAKVKVYDLLDQNVSARRTITPTAITDTENTVLQQYVMFSLTYKLEKFGGKKKDDNGMIFID